ncbi:MAG: hypothetical protein AB7O98_07520 [Hyphomonadaceae bacterium]
MSGGSLNRVVRTATRAGQARAVVEDDFHHFRVSLDHDGERITRIDAEPLRFPFSLCAAAGGELGKLIGAPLSRLAADIFRYTEPRLQCTHQFDLAALAMAAAARGHGRSYRVEAPDPVEGRMRAAVWRDGELVFAWDVAGYSVEGPAPFAGLGLGQGFTDWVTRNLSEDEAEAALVLRRGVFISRGRRIIEELDRSPHAPARGGCWVQQPGRAEQALREYGSPRDFTGRSDELTLSDEDWLRFAPSQSSPA